MSSLGGLLAGVSRSTGARLSPNHSASTFGSACQSRRTIAWPRSMTTTLTDERHRVFQIPPAFSAGFMKDSQSGRKNLTALSSQVSEGRIFGRSTRGPVRLGPFGHPGAGGSHAFADPENRISFAYVMNQMEQSLLPNEKSLRLVDAIYR